MFKLDNFGVILFVSRAIKNCYNIHLWTFKKSMQKSIFPQKFKKACVLQRRVCTQIQTQLSRKLQRFRTCRKNKKCSMFHDFFEYIIFSYDCKLLEWSFKGKAFSIWYYMIEAKIWKFWIFLLKSVILCEKSIQRITEALR